MIFLKFSYEPGVFGEQICDSSSTNFHLRNGLYLDLFKELVAGKKPFILQSENYFIGRCLFLSAIYWNVSIVLGP